MSRGKASGYNLTAADAKIVMGMLARNDREHDIAAWFGVNQGRVSGVKDGSDFGTVSAAPPEQLPPKGAPGPKGRVLRAMVVKAIDKLKAGNMAGGIAELEEGLKRYNANEA